MADIQVDPGEWVEIFDENTSGLFRIYSMLAKVKRSAILPTEGGVTVVVDEKTPSQLMINHHNGNLKLYIYNSGRTPGYVERDL